MAHVHITVNDMLKCYLLLDHRYNYTTPKTFLEPIKLYQNLLSVKRTQLPSKMDRIVKGLVKLSLHRLEITTNDSKIIFNLSITWTYMNL